MTLGEKLRQARKSLKLSQRELSEQMGFPQTTISDWELNKRYPDVAELKTLARNLDVDVIEFFSLV